MKYLHGNQQKCLNLVSVHRKLKSKTGASWQQTVKQDQQDPELFSSLWILKEHLPRNVIYFILLKAFVVSARLSRKKVGSTATLPLKT